MMQDPKMPYGGQRKDAAFAMLEEMDEMENPVAVADAPELLIPANLFPKGCKQGEIYTVKGKVGKVGSKVSFTPLEAFKPGAPDMEDKDTTEQE